jgi:hypothetical protein
MPCFVKTSKKQAKCVKRSLLGLYQVALQLGIGDATKPLSNLPRQLAPKKPDF